MNQYNLVVENIKCGGCANSILSKLKTIEGIQNPKVEVETGEVSFSAIDENMMTLVEQKLLSMGYPTEGNSNLATTAKSYVSCMIGRMK